jgi:hypothetical protein
MMIWEAFGDWRWGTFLSPLWLVLGVVLFGRCLDGVYVTDLQYPVYSSR